MSITQQIPAGGPEVPARPRSWGRRVRLLRHATQLAVTAVVAWEAVAHVRSGGPSAEGLCPFGGFETAWTWLTTGRTVSHIHPANLVLAGALVAIALIGRGFFCGWLCPFGAIQGALHSAGDAVIRRIPPLRRFRRRLQQGVAGRRLHRLDRVLRWGRWLVLGWAVIGAGITGTMVFREYDPWIALLSVAEFELSTAFAVLGLSLVLSLFVSRPFCRYACPLGAVAGLIGTLSPIAIQREASTCLGCDLCNRACPAGIPVNTRTRVTDTACIGCLECVAACPSAPALGVTFAVPSPGPRAADPVPDPTPHPFPDLTRSSRP